MHRGSAATPFAGSCCGPVPAVPAVQSWSASSALLQVVLVLCRLRPQCTFSHSRKATPPLLGMVAIAIALPPPSVHEIRLDSDMFVTRINFDFRIAHCEPRVSELLDYTAEELTGKNLYTLCHGEDANRLRKCHLDRKSSPLPSKFR